MAEEKSFDNFLKERGLNDEIVRSELDEYVRRRNPMASTGLDENYFLEAKEFDQGFLADVGTGLFNSLVMDTGEGIANLLPTMYFAQPQTYVANEIAKKAGIENPIGDFMGEWQDNVSNWFENQRWRYSDASYKPIEEFSDINASHVAKGVGEGIGFIAGILVGGAGAAKIAMKGASYASKAARLDKLQKAIKTTKAIDKLSAGKKLGMLKEAAQTEAAMQKISRRSQRLGTFMVGTNMMYPKILTEAKEAGLNDYDASQFALGVAGIVSLTEGAALEWIGNIATKPITGTLAKGVTKKTLKELKDNSVLGAQKLFTKNYAKKFVPALNKAIKGGGVEFGQEFVQTYIEQGAKNIWDVATKGLDLKDKGQFGVDATDYKTFVEATFGGMIGALLGSGMGVGGHYLGRKAKGESLEEETMFGYINHSVRNGNMSNIDGLKTQVFQMLDKGKITQEDANNINDRIDLLVDFAQKYKLSDIKSSTAQYQLYQLDNIQKDIDSADAEIQPTDDVNPSMAAKLKKKSVQLQMIKDRTQKLFDKVMKDKKPYIENKTEFEDILQGFRTMQEAVLNEDIENDTDLSNALDELYNPKEEAQTEQTETTIEQQKSDTERRREEVKKISKLPFSERIPALQKAGIIASNVTYNLGKRFPIILNIAGVKVAFYRSSEGTGGKQKGAWTPMFGFGEDKGNPWLIKGDIDSQVNVNYNSTAIKEYAEILNSTLNWDHELDKGKVENHPFFKTLTVAENNQEFNQELYGVKDLNIINGQSNISEYINSKLQEINAKYDAELAALETKQTQTEEAKKEAEKQAKEQAKAKTKTEGLGEEVEYEEVEERPFQNLTNDELQEELDATIAANKLMKNEADEQKIQQLEREQELRQAKKQTVEKEEVAEQPTELTEDEKLDLAEQEVQDIDEAAAYGELDKKETSLLKRIKRARKKGDKGLVDKLMSEFYDYQDRKKAKEDLLDLSNQQLAQEKEDVENKIKELGDEPNVFAVQRLGNRLKTINEEIARRESKEKKDKRTTELKRKQEVRRKKRKAKKKPELTTEEVKAKRVALEEDTRTTEKLDNDVAETFETSFDEVSAIDNLLEQNLTDEIAEVLNKGLPKDVSPELLQKLDYYIDNVLDVLSDNFPDSEYAEAIYDGLLDIKTEIDNEYESTYGQQAEAQEQFEEEGIREEEPTATEEAEEVEIYFDKEKQDKAKRLVEEGLDRLKNIKIYDDFTYEIINKSNSIHGDRNEDHIDYMAQNMGLKKNRKGVDSNVEYKIPLEYNEDYLVPLNSFEKNKIAEDDLRTAKQVEKDILLKSSAITIPEEGESTKVYTTKEAEDRLKKYEKDHEAYLKEIERIELEKYIYSYKVRKEKEQAKENIFEDIEFEEVAVPQDIKEQGVDKLMAWLSNIPTDATQEQIDAYTQELANKLEAESLKDKEDTTDEGVAQRVFANVDNGGLISQNPELHNKIKKHFRNIFPNLSVAEVDRIISKYGGKVLGRLSELGIEIDKNSAVQSTIIHEYAEAWIDVMGINHPLVQLGLEQMRDTDLHEQAKVLYPHLSEQEQLKEAFAEALAISSLNKLQTKFEGTRFKKFVALAKRVWNWIRNRFTKQKSRDIVELVSDSFVKGKKSYSIDNSSIKGIKEQRTATRKSSRFSKALDIVNVGLILHRLQLKNNDKVKNKLDERLQGLPDAIKQKILNQFKGKVSKYKGFENKAYRDLLYRYYAEKSNLMPDNTNMMYEGINLNLPQASRFETKEQLDNAIITPEDINVFQKLIEQNDKELKTFVDKIITEMYNLPIESNNLAEFLDAEQSILEQQENKNHIKADKRVNASVNNIISSILDQDGNLINKDRLFNYITYKANNAISAEDFVSDLRYDAQDTVDSNGNIVRYGDIAAQRLLQIIDGIKSKNEATYRGLINSLSSLTSYLYIATLVESEEFAPTPEQEFEGKTKEVKKRVKFQIVNKDNQIGGKLDIVKSRLKSKIGTQEGNRFLNKLKRKAFQDPVTGTWTSQLAQGIAQNNPDVIDNIATNLSAVLDIKINPEDIQGLADAFGGPIKFANRLESKFASVYSVLDGKYEVEQIDSTLSRILEYFEETTQLRNNFLNRNGNSITTTQNGHYIMRKLARLQAKRVDPDTGKKVFKTKELEIKQKSPYYENNPLIEKGKNWIGKGKLKYGKFDAVSNITNNTNKEYSYMSAKDYLLNQFFMYATNQSGVSYNQTFGIKSNRDSISLFNVPKYTKSELKTHYDNQAKMLDKIYQELTRGATQEQKDALAKGLEDMFLHKVVNGKVVSGFMHPSHQNEIQEIQKMLKEIDYKDFILESQTKETKSIHPASEIVEMFYYTEALNRTSLNDIFSGNSLWFKSPQKDTKRRSGADSTGLQDDIGGEIKFIQFNSVLPNGDIIADSLDFNSPTLYENQKTNRGDIDNVGESAKDQIYQVLPDGKLLYLKNLSLNVSGQIDNHTLTSYGEVYNRIGNALIKIQNQFPNVQIKLFDDNVSKGTWKANKNWDLNELLDTVENTEDLTSFVEGLDSIDVHGHTTLNQSHKTLKSPNKQTTVMGTQGALIQFNNLPVELQRYYEDAVLDYLRKNLKGDINNNGNIKKMLMGVKRITTSLANDLNDREASVSTELLEEVIKYNQENPDNEIVSLDHPHLRRLTEQHISSQLTKRGIKIDMAGDFLVQLPDLNTAQREAQDQLAMDEIAVGWKFIFPKEPTQEQKDNFLNSEDNKIVALRIPTSAEMSMFGGRIAKILDTDSNQVIMSKRFHEVSDSDNDGDKAMIYRRAIGSQGQFLKGTTSIGGKVSIGNSQSAIFDSLYENVTQQEFIDKQQGETLDFDKYLTDILVEKGMIEPVKPGEVAEGEFRTNSINAISNRSVDMSFGADATGRFSIASKVTSLLSQYRDRVKKPIKWVNQNGQEEELTNFVNTRSTDIAILLQAALDMGNNPILTLTGINSHNINVVNLGLSLGKSLGDMIDVVNDPEVMEMIQQVEDGTNSFSTERAPNLDAIVAKQFYKGKGVEKRYYSFPEMKEMYSNGKYNFIQLYKTAQDLSMLIRFVQLDKSTPNNAKDIFLMENMKSFGLDKINLTTDFITSNRLYTDPEAGRLTVLQDARNIMDNHLVTANRLLNKEILRLAKGVAKSKFDEDAIFKSTDEVVTHMIAQNQINKQRGNIEEFIDNTQDKLASIRENAFGQPVQLSAEVRDAIDTTVNFEQAKQDLIDSYGYSEARATREINEAKQLIEAQNQAEALKGNTFIENLNVKYQKDKGKIVKDENDMPIVTDVTFGEAYRNDKKLMMKVREDFKKLQELDGELAQDIIDYQLYRYGVNNKIGSFIDVLPIDINIQFMKDSSVVLNQQDWIQNNLGRIKDAVKFYNQDRLAKFEAEDYKGFSRGDKFIQYNTDGMLNNETSLPTGEVLTQEEIDLKNKCKR